MSELLDARRGVPFRVLFAVVILASLSASLSRSSPAEIPILAPTEPSQATAQDLEKGMKAKEVEVRLATVNMLSRDKDPKTEKLLVNALKDEDWEVAESAADALGERGTKASLDALVKLAIDAPLARMRFSAAQAIGKIAAEEGAADLLRKASADPTAATCDALATALRGADTKLDLKVMAKHAEKAKDPAAREAAARAVAAAGAKDRGALVDKILQAGGVRATCAVLEEMALHPREKDLERALLLLARVKLDDCVERRAARVAEAACSALAEAQAVDALKPLLTSHDAIVAARGAHIVARLAASGEASSAAAAGSSDPAPKKAILGADAAFAALAPVLEHAGERAREAAAAALSNLSGQAVIDRARALAKSDRNARVRAAALRAACALAPASDDASRALLESLLGTDADADVRMQAAVLLGRKGLGEALPALIAACNDKDWGVGVCAAVSLGKTQAQGALEPLTRLAKGASDWKLRAAAVVGLSRTYLKGSIPPAIAALSDADPSVAKEAHGFLMAVSRETLPPKVEAWNEWWAKNSGGVLLVDPATQDEYKKRFGDSSTSAPVIFQSLDVVVLQSRGDRIERVLKDQAIAHRITQAGHVKECGLTADGLFVSNCTGEIEEADVERVRWFVLAGGSLFGSCWALHETIERALPGVLVKHETQGEVLARVEARAAVAKSAYLEGVFAPGIVPIYALEGAHLIDVVDLERAEVLVDSPECAEQFGCGNLAAWFSAGHGTVLDSVNHFNDQGLEQALGLKTPLDRQAYAVDHLGLTYVKLRAVRNEKWWDSNLKASEKIVDLSVFRLITNFVRLRRLALRW